MKFKEITHETLVVDKNIVNEYFRAMAAIEAMGVLLPINPEKAASLAVSYADALMKELAK